jgi:hypothetical protein
MSLPQALMRRLRSYSGSEKFSWEEIRIELRDPKLYLSGLIQFMQDILLYGFSTFLPSILKAMSYDTLQSNYLTIPVYLWGAIIFLSLAWVSDRHKIRGPVSLILVFVWPKLMKSSDCNVCQRIWHHWLHLTAHRQA